MNTLQKEGKSTTIKIIQWLYLTLGTTTFVGLVFGLFLTQSHTVTSFQTKILLLIALTMITSTPFLIIGSMIFIYKKWSLISTLVLLILYLLIFGGYYILNTYHVLVALQENLTLNRSLVSLIFVFNIITIYVIRKDLSSRFN